MFEPNLTTEFNRLENVQPKNCHSAISILQINDDMKWSMNSKEMRDNEKKEQVNTNEVVRLSTQSESNNSKIPRTYTVTLPLIVLPKLSKL